MSDRSAESQTRIWLDGHIRTTSSALARTLPRWTPVAEQLSPRLAFDRHGDLPRWARALDSMPEAASAQPTLGNRVSIVGQVPNDSRLTDALRELKPWRKGPFELFSQHIDTEWRSDWKWQRLAGHLPSLSGQRVLDIGCGNGYYGWRMLESGASQVVGVDPTVLFVIQHAAICRYMPAELRAQNLVLPLRLEDAPAGDAEFDAVFSMGVLYHRRDPIEHLREIVAHTQPDGLIVLETLVTPTGDSFVPEQRYARMRNVWCVPTVSDLLSWCETAGLRNARCVDVTRTSTDEQRSTDWMTFESLDRCLDPSDPSRTIEGYPAPHRAIVLANAG